MGIFSKMMNKTKIALALLGVFVLSGCLENDIPLPKIELFITGIDADGMVGGVQINNDERTVSIQLDETVNMRKVHINKLQVTDKAKSSLPNDTLIDLTSPYPITLSLYQDYKWTLKASQKIERVFNVKGQIGEAQFFPDQRYATLNIGSNTSLHDIQLTALKLGPAGSTINMTTLLPKLTWENCGTYARTRVLLNYSDFIVMHEWTLYVYQVASSVSTTSADGWVYVAWLYGAAQEGKNNGFELREESSDEWTTVDDKYITQQGSSFYARVPHLKAATKYVCRAYSNDEKGNEITFTTGTAVALPNGSFNNWFKEGKVWQPWAEGGQSFWDTGNDGATTLGESITTPSQDIAPGAQAGTTSAMLSSKFVGLGSIGKFAAGNIFIGEYVRTDGTNGILSFGKPFTARPTKLTGYYKYTAANVDCLPQKGSDDYTRFESYLGKPDTMSVYIALGDWDQPMEIRTNPKNRKLFDVNDPHIIAFKEFNRGTSTDGWEKLDVPIDYRSTSRIPKYIIMVCSASKFGDFFTGGSGATLWVDELNLEYDY